MTWHRALTDEQILAAAKHSSLYLESYPGSGKTTVAAVRFGAHRFDSTARGDQRAVVAISFTRSATRELANRVRRFWTSDALAFPHRIVTVDTVVCELLHHLLATGAVQWPSGHTELTVLDAWSAVHKLEYVNTAPMLTVRDREVTASYRTARERSNQVRLADFRSAISAGICTHEDVRAVLDQLIRNDAAIRDLLIARLRDTTRALIVDEVFDGNELDLNLVTLAVSAGARVTIIGDPWQALYGFRGARPDAVPLLVEQLELPTMPLTASFRWKTDEQKSLANLLRDRRPTELPRGAPENVDVVLCCEWKRMWDALPSVLPLAFSGAKGTLPEPGSTV